MRDPKGYSVEKLSASRSMVAAASSVNRQNNVIHLMTQADISTARRLIGEHKELTGERLSLTGYVVACLARTFDDFPRFNAMRKGSHLVVFDDLTVSVLLEREIEGESAPQPIALHEVNRKSLRQINDELRGAQEVSVGSLGEGSGVEWVRYVPGSLLRFFIRLAARNIGMAKRFGVVGVTSIGMFGAGPLWLVPLTNATVTVGVGAIESQRVHIDGAFEERESLCLTISFNHDIVDGAPAARFVARFGEELSSAEILTEPTSEAPA